MIRSDQQPDKFLDVRGVPERVGVAPSLSLRRRRRGRRRHTRQGTNHMYLYCVFSRAKLAEKQP